MTSLDRAFIKAFAESPAAGPRHGAAPQRAKPQPMPPIAGPHEPMASALREPAAARPRMSRPDNWVPPWVAPAPPPPKATAPLSTFAARTQPEKSAESAVEIDELAWPAACGDLVKHAARSWDRFADHLSARIALGGTCIAIASCSSGEGRTTITLAAAKHLAARGVRVAVVDADFGNPTLAPSCRIAPQAGWDDVLEDNRPLAGALISAVGEGVTLVPWRGGSEGDTQPGDEVRLAAVFETLKERYDVVLLDTAPLASPEAISDFAALARAIRLDAVHMIRDARATTGEALADACAHLQQEGVEVAGVIENFVDPSNVKSPRLPTMLRGFVTRLLARRG